MSISITVRWAGPSDAGASSTYKIERTTDNAAWSTLAASQAATSPYVSPASTLSAGHAYGVATVSVVSGTAFSTSGYGYVDGEALIQWTGKTSNDLTGVTWHTGYGTYLTGSAVVEAHESYADTPTPSLNAVLYRITHTNAAGNASAPAYLWYYYPPAPASSEHCVVVVLVFADLGLDAQDNVAVNAYITADTNFSNKAGLHLDSNQTAGNVVTLDAFGMACLQCWKSAARAAKGGGAAASYTFVLDSGDASNRLTVVASTIPDRDWVLLKDIADA